MRRDEEVSESLLTLSRGEGGDDATRSLHTLTVNDSGDWRCRSQFGWGNGGRGKAPR